MALPVLLGPVVQSMDKRINHYPVDSFTIATAHEANSRCVLAKLRVYTKSLFSVMQTQNAFTVTGN